MRELFEKFKKRKLIQWGVAYLAGAWLVVQLVEVFGTAWGLPVGVSRALHVVLLVGLVAMLVLAWYHGEQGRQRVSGPELLMLGTLFLLAGIGVTLVSARGLGDAGNREASAVPSAGTAAESASPFAGRPGIAVLPFDNRSNQEEDEYFTAGIHDELLTALQRLPGLKVISRTSVEAYRNSEKTVPVIAKELGVRYVLEGGVQRVAQSVRINLQLIDGTTDDHIWSETFDRSLTAEALLEVQSEIVRNVAGQLGATLSQEEWARVARTRTSDDEAYDLFMRASMPRMERDEQEEAIRLLEAAVDRDPEFLSAHARLSMAHAMAYQMWPDQTPARRRAALRSVETALALDSTSAEAKLAMGSFLYRIDQDWDGAIEWLERSSGRLHSDPVYHTFRGFAERRAGRWEAAVRSLEVATELNPRSAEPRRTFLATLGQLRRYDEGDRQLALLKELTPNEAAGHIVTANYELARDGLPGQWVEAYLAEEPGEWLLAEFGRWDDLLELMPSLPEVVEYQDEWSPREAYLGQALEGLGRRDEARKAYERAADTYERRLEKTPDDPRVPSGAAYTFAALGWSERALEAADHALELQPPERDANEAHWFLVRHALTQLRLGMRTEALATLEQLLGLPGDFSVPRLEAHVGFATLHDDPAFQALMDEYRNRVF